jgi:tetratricopeptide (TPR) repeat protein
MKKFIFVVFSLLLASSCFADTLNKRLSPIEIEWEKVFYTYPAEKQSAALQPLLKQANEVRREFPSRAEPIILQAGIILTNAATQSAFAALKSVKKARELLLKAIAIDPEAKEGSAFVTLGTLYYKVPGWPIAFGNDDEAERLLLTALKISPDAVDSNYYFGDFLLSQGKPSEAARYFTKVLKSPISDETRLGKRKLREKAKLALNNTTDNKISKAEQTLYQPSLIAAQ